MNSTPPHLPPKACNVKTHKTFQSLGWLLFLIAVASLTSVALTLATLVWFIPSFIPDQLVNNIQKGDAAQNQKLDLEIYNNTRRRVWNIYDKRQKIDNLFYSNSADVLQALMFSSDGWAVVYAPDYYPGLEKFWEGINYQGVPHKIEKVFVDSVSGFTYVKFAGDGFSFISFANWDDLDQGATVWTLSNNQIKQQILKQPARISKQRNYSIWQPQFLYNLPDAKEGDIVINSDGELVGLIDEKNNIIFGWMVDNQYASILDTGVPNYTAVEWSGSMVSGFLNQDDFTIPLSGFYVAKSPTRATSSTVGVGDLILRIQNESTNGAEISRQMLSAPDQFLVGVLREGQEIDIMVEKTRVK